MPTLAASQERSKGFDTGAITAAADGKILWEYDTSKDFQTVNGVKANGGSMSNAGATVVGGMVFMNSGYSHHGGITPGNVLLAFSVE